MPPLLSISAFRRTDANGGSRGEAMPERENIKNVNIVKREQIMAETFGHSKDLITLSLSLSLSHALTASHTLLRFAGDRALIYGFSCTRATDGAAREEPSLLVLFRVATEVEHSSREAAVFFVPHAAEDRQL